MGGPKWYVEYNFNLGIKIRPKKKNCSFPVSLPTLFFPAHPNLFIYLFFPNFFFLGYQFWPKMFPNDVKYHIHQEVTKKQR